MKKTVSKKDCRQLGDPGFIFDRDNGLLHSAAYQYILRTTVRNIAGQRYLLLCIYPRERLLEGDFSPRWIVFQTKSDYLTLSFRDDGTTTWQVSMFDNLEREWNFKKLCAFYTHKDEQRVAAFCKNGKTAAFESLYCLQSTIKEQRELVRRYKKQRKTLARMEGIPALPRDLKGWIHREILPQYLFYQYRKDKKPTVGYCTACRHEVTVTGAKHNQAAPCPRCKKMVTHKSRGRMGHIYHQESVQVLQSLENGEILIRLLKVYCSYRKKDVPDITISEATRIFVRQNEEGKLISEPYCNFWQYRNDLTPWKPGYYPVMHVYRRNFYAEVTAHLYCRNLDEVLDGTAWKYAQLKRFYLDDREAIEVVPFLSYYLHHPKLEMLIKLGFGSIATDLIYRSHFSLCLHEEKRKAHEILGVEADDIPFLRDCKINLRGLHTYQKYVEVKLRDRNKLFLWQLEHEIAGDDTFMTALQYISVHKLIRYLDEQYAYMSKRKINGVGRNNGMHFVLRTYDDYLRMCEKEKYDMSNTFILFPKDLRISHDRVSARIKLKADIETRRQFMEVYREITSQMDFERYGLKIVCPQKPEDIIKEGHVLRHCVGSYIERIANRSCFILFLRQQKNPQKPYYTVEVKEGKVSQVRGGQNSAPTKDVERFIKAWERRGLYSAAVAAA